MMRRGATIGQLQDVIRGIQSGFSAFYALVLAPYGVSFPQFALLLCLARRRPQKMSEVAAVLRITLPAVTSLVDRLERKGLVRRQPHPTDRRATLLDLTAKGRSVVARTQGRTLRMLTRTFLQRPPRARATILGFMQALHGELWKVVHGAQGKS